MIRFVWRYIGKGWRHFENISDTERLDLFLVPCTCLLCLLSLFFHPNTPATQFLYEGYLILLYTLTSVYGFSAAIGNYGETYKWPLYIKLRKSVLTKCLCNN